MGKYDIALKHFQSERLKKASELNEAEYPYDEGYHDGYIDGLERGEEILYRLQNISKSNGRKLWYTGSPNDLKPNNRGTYILIMRSKFDNNDEEDPIKVGDIKIDMDFWDGNHWQHHNSGWEVVYFTKLKWVMFPIPSDLGIKRSDDIFFN